MIRAARPGPAGPARGWTTAATVFSEATGRGGAVFNAGLRVWEGEAARYVEELAVQGRNTFGRLCECKTPLDVLSVEQEWLRARSRFYLESGMRFADAFAAVARESDGGGAEKAQSAARPGKGEA